jgi:hypothetical protein
MLLHIQHLVLLVELLQLEVHLKDLFVVYKLLEERLPNEIMVFSQLELLLLLKKVVVVVVEAL